MRRLTSAKLFLAVSLLTALCSNRVRAEKATVFLRNGGQAQGDIVVYLPNDRITLDLGGGERMTFLAAEVSEVRRDAGSSPTIAASAHDAPSGSVVAAAPSPGAPAQPGAPALSAPIWSPAAVGAPQLVSARENPMGRFGIGLKLGLAGSVDLAADENIMERSPQLRVALPINLGGDGFGWLLEPSLSVGRAHQKFGGARGDSHPLVSAALYTGPTFNMHLSDPFYLSIGVGTRFSYSDLVGPEREPNAEAFELTARVPVTATVYLKPDLALVAEACLGAGYAWYTMFYNGDNAVLVYDASAGIRWP